MAFANAARARDVRKPRYNAGRANKSLDASGTSALVIDNLSVTWLSPAASTQPLGGLTLTLMDQPPTEEEMIEALHEANFDVAQICLNGHLINETATTHAENNQPFCEDC